MQVNVQLNYLHIAPRKVRLLAHLLKGMSVAQAERSLTHLPKRAALPMLKLLRSAVANASRIHEAAKDSLKIENVRVDAGPVQKRMMPRAFGRGAVIRKRMSHVSLTLGWEVGPDKGKERHGARKGDHGYLREISPDEVGGRGIGSRDRREMKSFPSRPKQKGFVQRMFRRKAI